MVRALPSGNLVLSIKDFGPIVEANVDLRPLTIFVGPSNTGKSYLSILTYALHQVFAQKRTQLGFAKYFRRRPRRINRAISRSSARALISWVQSLEESATPTDLPQEAERAVRSGLDDYFQETGREFAEELARCFGIDDIHQLPRRSRDRSATVVVRKDNPETTANELEYRLIISRGQSQVQSTIPRLPELENGSDIFRTVQRKFDYRTVDDDELSYVASSFVNDITDSMLPQLVGALNRPIYYLPADRTGVMHAHRVVVSALLERAQYGGVRRDARIGVLSGVLGDFLQHLIELDPFPTGRRNSQRHRRTAQNLEDRVLQGAIRNEPSETGYPSFFYRPEYWRDELPLMNASSMVSELAPVVLFLRHIVEKDSVLIIEEPESHLHPSMQVEFIRLLAGAVQDGLRVILTTHSEWVIETVGNLVELSGVPRNRRDTLPGGAYALRKEDVGVWLFRKKNSPRGSVVEEVLLDPEAGTFGVGYDAIAEELHNEWADATSEPG